MSGGLIEYFGLSHWWDESFTAEERSIVRERVSKPFSAFREIDSGIVTYSSLGNVAVLLCSLASWFTRSDLRPIGRKFAEEGEKSLGQIDQAKDLHFALCDLIDFWKRMGGERERELALCRKQAALAPIVAPIIAR